MCSKRGLQKRGWKTSFLFLPIKIPTALTPALLNRIPSPNNTTSFLKNALKLQGWWKCSLSSSWQQIWSLAGCAYPAAPGFGGQAPRLPCAPSGALLMIWWAHGAQSPTPGSPGSFYGRSVPGWMGKVTEGFPPPLQPAVQIYSTTGCKPLFPQLLLLFKPYSCSAPS